MGTSLNNTACVVASGYAFSEAAGDFATTVKLTRNSRTGGDWVHGSYGMSASQAFRIC